MAAAAAAAERAALGGRNPNPNPNGDGPKVWSPPGKGKPVALADITNTGRPNPTRSISVADVVKENAKLIHLLSEKTKIIELSKVEMQKLRLALQASRQQNLQLAQTNSQMLAELNLGKDRLKTLQHELSCTTAVLKVKASELERKNKTANQRRKEVNSQEVMKAIPSKVDVVEAHGNDGSVNSTDEQHFVESQSAVPSNTGCQGQPLDTTKTRGRNKRKSVSSDANIFQDNYRPHLQPIMSLDQEDLRKPLRRRSARLNPGASEVTEASRNTLHEDAVVSLSPSSLSVQKQHGQRTGRDMGKSLQNEHTAIVHEHEVLMDSEFKRFEINEQTREAANLKEIQEACSSVPGAEVHQIADKATSTIQSHLTETPSSLPFNIIEPPEPQEDAGNKRGTNKQKLELCESGEKSTEDKKAKCDSSASVPLRHKEKRSALKSQRRKSARLNPVSSEDTKSSSETLQEDVIAPLVSSSSNALMEQRSNQNQTDGRSSMQSIERQVAGRRSLRRAAEKVVSYKEIPVNIKMRRP